MKKTQRPARAVKVFLFEQRAFELTEYSLTNVTLTDYVGSLSPIFYSIVNDILRYKKERHRRNLYIEYIACISVYRSLCISCKASMIGWSRPLF